MPKKEKMSLLKTLVGLFVVVITCMPVSVAAGEVGLQQAKEIARQFLSEKLAGQQTSSRRLLPRHVVATDTAEVQPYYLFNIGQQEGFVIVGGDDTRELVLGYSDTGSIDPVDMPDALRCWLDGYANWPAQTSDTSHAPSKAARQPKAAIAPLIQTRWSQYEPYNMMCPVIEGKRCLTGCVATSIAQVLNYYRCPQPVLPEIPAYAKLPVLPETSIDWNLLSNTYTMSDSTTAKGMEVAKLMRYVGQALNMNYGTASSGANERMNTLVKYFGMSTSAHAIEHNFFPNDVWEELIYQELASSRPVIYSGRNAVAGHSFICDGYDGNGYFHYNFGWGGGADGYYLSGLSGSYSFKQEAFIGIKPAQEHEAYVFVYNRKDLNYSNSGAFGARRSSVDEDFTDVTLTAQLWLEEGSQACKVVHAWGLFRNDSLKCVIGEETVTVKGGTLRTATDGGNIYEGARLSGSYSFGANLEDGNYQLRDIYHEVDSTEWKTCLRSYGSYYDVTINKTYLNATGREMPEGNRYSVTDVILSPTRKIGKPMTVRVNVKNDDQSGFNQPLYAELNGQLVGGASAYLKPGESGYVDISFTPEKAGRQQLTIWKSKEHQSSTYWAEWADSIDIFPVNAVQLSGSLDVDGLRNNGKQFFLEGNTADVVVDVTNVDEKDYDGEVFISQYVRTADGQAWSLCSTVNKPISIQPGGSGKLAHSLTGLTKGKEYMVAVHYPSGGIDNRIGSLLQFVADTKCELTVDSVVPRYGTVYRNKYNEYDFYLRNTGESEIKTICFQTDGTWYRNLDVSIKPGETYVRDWNYTPEAVGSHTITIGSALDGRHTTYATFEFPVAEPQEQRLSIDVDQVYCADVKPSTDEYPFGTCTLTVPITIINEGQNDYHDIIQCVVKPVEERNNGLWVSHRYPIRFFTPIVHVKKGQTLQWQQTIKDAEATNTYKVQTLYYTPNQWVPIENSIKPTTAIVNVTLGGAKGHVNDGIYSLSGQRLSAPRKGVNIVGGKKVVIPQ